VPKVCLTDEKIYLADYLGIVPYELALDLQQRLVQARAEGDIPDVVLLLQHPSVFTIGRFRGEEDVILPFKGIEVFPTNRGGSVTYHGPGQLVGYPILNLKENELGVRDYIWKLEEVIIKLLLDFGIRAQRMPKHPGGVWVGKDKICSIGIHVSHYVTTHGFALNVNADLRYFEYIRPCGLKNTVMTSISKLLGYPVEVEAVIESWLQSFSEIFGLKRETGIFLPAEEGIIV
jgi:lipoate-protein ligase B